MTDVTKIVREIDDKVSGIHLSADCNIGIYFKAAVPTLALDIEKDLTEAQITQVFDVYAMLVKVGYAKIEKPIEEADIKTEIEEVLSDKIAATLAAKEEPKEVLEKE